MEYKLICYIVILKFIAVNVLCRRQTRENDKPYSILRKCLNSTIQEDECLFLRNYPRLWNEFRDIRHQIRRLKIESNKPAVPVKELISIEQMKLTMLQLKIGVTRNNEQGILLGKNISKLKDEDDRFRKSVRYIKETEILALQKEIVKLQNENINMKYELESYMKNESKILHEKINKLQTENELLKHNQKIIQDESLAFVRQEIKKIQRENEDMKSNFKLLMQQQEDVLNKRINDTDASLTTVNTIVDTFQLEQNKINIENKLKIHKLFDETQHLMELNDILRNDTTNMNVTFKGNILQSLHIISGVNKSLNMLINRSLKQNKVMYEHISRINNTSAEINKSVVALTENTSLEHINIHVIVTNLSLRHEQFVQEFEDYTRNQEIIINVTKEEVHALWKGKAYVNNTLQSIVQRQDEDNNQTNHAISSLHNYAIQQDTRFVAYKNVVQAENVALQEQITSLKHHNELQMQTIDNLQIYIQEQGNNTNKELLSLQYIDNLINESLNSVIRQLSGPYLMFTAYPSQTYINYDSGDKLVFDKVILNYGKYYNKQDGSFTCPVHGVYQSFVSVWSEFDNRAQIELMRGNTVIIKAAAQPDPGSRQHGSNMANFVCNRGQVVWLRGGTYGMLYTDEHRQNSFSTTLLLNLEYHGTDNLKP